MGDIRVGVIGTGQIGTEHINRLNRIVRGACVSAVTDVDKDKSRHILDAYADIQFFDEASVLIQSSDVDAVVVTAGDPLHAGFVLEAIKAGKPVFTEKPLATTAKDAKSIIDAEMSFGKRLVSVGFMRRFDMGYQALKKELKTGEIGMPLIAYCTHTNPEIPDSVHHFLTDEMIVTGTAIHEIDCMSWLLDDYFVSAQRLKGRKTSNLAVDKPELNDPYVLVMKTSQDIMVILQVFVNCRYGYDIRCEVICETGTAKMPEPFMVQTHKNCVLGTRIYDSWKDRFRQAYDTELQYWIDQIITGDNKDLPTAWDGYRAALMSDACIEAIRTNQEIRFEVEDCPAFYKNL